MHSAPPVESPSIRIAVWSGPRTVSTALMRSFEARGDCAVVDEPLYAAYLAATGLDHPGRAEILRSQPTDPAEALAALARPTHGAPLQYEKQMAHHWRPGWPLDALAGVRHGLLIRSPERMVSSYAKVREAPIPSDLGYDRLRWLLDSVEPAFVVDGDELLDDPAAYLAAVCAALGIPYTDRMTRWPAGRRPTDGVWAPHWYRAVEASTGFGPPPAGPAEVPDALRWVVDAVRPAYDALAAVRIRLG
ncbi:MAG: HAD family hydrolase [Myxococcota bacterium]